MRLLSDARFLCDCQIIRKFLPNSSQKSRQNNSQNHTRFSRGCAESHPVKEQWRRALAVRGAPFAPGRRRSELGRASFILPYFVRNAEWSLTAWPRAESPSDRIWCKVLVVVSGVDTRRLTPCEVRSCPETHKQQPSFNPRGPPLVGFDFIQSHSNSG